MSSNITIKVIEASDYQSVAEFLHDYFYPEEPLHLGCELHEIDPDCEKFVMSNIEYGTSVMAELKLSDSSKVVVGVIITGPKAMVEEQTYEFEAERFSNSKWGKMAQLLAEIEKNANVFQNFNTNKVLHIHVRAVHTQWRGKAVGDRMFDKLLQLGSELGYQVLTSDCTSFYSARFMQRKGCECINEVLYKNYRDEYGEQIFKPPAPHEAVRTYARRL